MACCTARQAKVKKIAIKKATMKANHLAKIGKIPTPKPTKVKPTKVKPKKVAAKAVKPCTLCGKKTR